MYGNLHAPTDLAQATASPALTLWLGAPAAEDYFDAALLTDADRARWLAHRNSSRQQEFKVSRALTGFALSSTETHSLSHSGGHAALLAAPSGVAVGVDVEMSRPRDVLKIARFAFPEQEVAALEELSGAAREELFYTLWTFKESLAKALQLRLIDALQQCVFSNDRLGWRGSVPTQAPWFVRAFRPRPGLFLAAACIGASAPSQLQMWEWPPQQTANWPLLAVVAVPGEPTRGYEQLETVAISHDIDPI